MPPALPSSFYGAAAGAKVAACTGEGACAEVGVTEHEGRPFYALNVPADDPATPAVEGGRPGDVVTFRVDGVVVPETAVWEAGGNRRVDLTPPAP